MAQNDSSRRTASCGPGEAGEQADEPLDVRSVSSHEFSNCRDCCFGSEVVVDRCDLAQQLSDRREGGRTGSIDP